ncbi:unnamed protein product [Mytilus coruscus]|uniref:Uncharacterized protein n=1 Tax=Mytilus coruscus TaxID=42192 RepID=A0A6J8BYJ9_MYTCO|nr:unnamed protein product [Mytilus coruscus]
MDGEKRQTFGNDVVRRIRSFMFGKRTETHSNNNYAIPCENSKLLRLTDTTTMSTNQEDNNQQQKKDEEQQQQQQQQQQQENNEKEAKTEAKIPFLLFVKCAKNCLSSKQSRQQLYREGYTYFWNFLFGNAAAKARMAEEEYYYEFYANFEEEF